MLANEQFVVFLVTVPIVTSRAAVHSILFQASRTRHFRHNLFYFILSLTGEHERTATDNLQQQLNPLISNLCVLCMIDQARQAQHVTQHVAHYTSSRTKLTIKEHTNTLSGFSFTTTYN